MAQVDVEATNTGRATLRSLERVGKGTAIANEIFGLVGRSLFFAEFSREDISILAGYMDVYRAQTGETIIRENDGGDFMLLIIEAPWTSSRRGCAPRSST